MLSAGDQEKACNLITQIQGGNLVQPVVEIRRDEIGTITLNPVDRSNETLHTEFQTILNDVELTDDYQLRNLQDDLAALDCWPETLPVDVSQAGINLE